MTYMEEQNFTQSDEFDSSKSTNIQLGMKKIIVIVCGLFFLPTHNATANYLPGNAKIFCGQEGAECIAIASVPNNDCMVCSQPVAYVSHDNKKTWQLTENIDIRNGDTRIDSLRCRQDMQHCVAFGQYGTGRNSSEFVDALVLTSHDKGYHWINQHFGCPEFSFSVARIHDYYCSSSWNHCVAVGFCSDGLQPYYYLMGLYFDLGHCPNPYLQECWAWSSGLDRNIHGELKKVTCTEEIDANVSCKADGVAGDWGTEEHDITAISKDSGKNWVIQQNVTSLPIAP